MTDYPRGGDLFHRLGLRPFGALGDLKLDLVAFIQDLKPDVSAIAE